MPRDERLHDTLLELQSLQDREARALRDTQALLACLEAYSTAPGPREALVSLFASFRSTIGSSRTVLVEREPTGALRIRASDLKQDIGRLTEPPFDLFGRTRNLTDVHLLGDWAGEFDVSGFAGTIIIPVSPNHALITFRNAPHGFRKKTVHFVKRLAGLALQALNNGEIAAENELLAATIAGSSNGFAIADATAPERPLVYVNKAFETISGYTSDEALGHNCRFLGAEAPDTPERTRLRAAVEACEGGTFLLRNRRKSGELFWNELTLFPVASPSDGGQYLVASQSDVTDRVEAAAARDRLENRMIRALSATDDAFLMIESDGSIAFANSAVDRLFPAGTLAWQSGSLFHDNWARYLDHARDLPGRTTGLLKAPDLKALAALPSGREVDLPDGVSVLLRAAELDDGGLVVSATDVTAMKSAQHLLSQRLAAIEAATDGIAVTDRDGRLIYQNKAAARLMGFSSPNAGLGHLWQSRYAGSEATAVDPGAAFETRRNRTTAPQTEIHQITGSPITTGGAVIILRDITKDLVTEARETELMRELIRLQRQEAIAQLTAGVAHDFNNLLSAINGSATLIGMSAHLPAEVQPHVDRILAAGAQSAKMISRLLDVGAAPEADGTFDLSSVLTDLPALLHTNLPQNVTFTIQGQDRGLALQGSPGTLSQVLINMALNAGDAIGAAKGEITLTVSKCIGAQAPEVSVGDLAAGRPYASLAVCDTGHGMDAETAENIFRPYFTTKGRQGTGLGLATAAMQVQSVGGAIALKTAPGAGTTLTIYWPLHQQDDIHPGTTRAPGCDLSQMTIIVVDDDANVAEVIGSYLEACGAEVAICPDPRDAIEAVQDDPGSWSAVVTDYDMPIMNGGALISEIRAIAPHLPVFLVTALARRLSDPRVTNGQTTGIFAKPVDLGALSEALANAKPTP